MTFKRVMHVGFSAAACLVAALLLLAPAAMAQAPDEDSVTGAAATGFSCSGESCTLAGVELDARSAAFGAAPTGTVALVTAVYHRPTDPAPEVHRVGGRVTCLFAHDGNATVGAELQDPDRPGRWVLFFVHDGGVDSLRVEFPSAPPTRCPSAASGPLAAVLAGDLAVHDAVPAPSTETACLNGGWQAYGFTGERRCVRFVRLIPGLPPWPMTAGECSKPGWQEYAFRNMGECVRFVHLAPLGG